MEEEGSNMDEVENSSAGEAESESRVPEIAKEVAEAQNEGAEEEKEAVNGTLTEDSSVVPVAEEMREQSDQEGILIETSGGDVSVSVVDADDKIDPSNEVGLGDAPVVLMETATEDNVIEAVTAETLGEVKPEDSVEMEEEEATPSSSYYAWPYQIPSEFCPKCLVVSGDSEFRQEDKGKKTARYVKGYKWAPDGSCLISCADDDSLRLFNFPSSFSSITDWTSEDSDKLDSNTEEWLSSLKVREGGLIYDYCWYPFMSSMDPVSSCFLSTSSEAPIHLWDAFTGKLRASYTPYNHLDQVISAYSLAFDPTGQTIYSGFEKSVRIFNITRPGRECTLRSLKQPFHELNQYGIVASIAVNPSMSSFYAVGTFDKSIGLYYDDGSVICLLQGHAGGITNMKFSGDGVKLFTGGRRDSRLICWDMRKMGEAYKIYDRVVSTHQRIYFDLASNDRYLLSGGTDGIVKVWDLLSEDLEPCCTFRSNSDCVNGVSLNPYVPVLATSSGQRHFFEVAEDSDDEELFVKSKSSQERSCDVKLWKFA